MVPYPQINQLDLPVFSNNEEKETKLKKSNDLPIQH